MRGRYELPRRWYRLKAKLLGLERLADYDRIAPLASDELEVPWADARALVQEVYGGFSPTLGGIVERFFDEQLDRRAAERPASAAARSASAPCRRCTPT